MVSFDTSRWQQFTGNIYFVLLIFVSLPYDGDDDDDEEGRA